MDKKFLLLVLVFFLVLGSFATALIADNQGFQARATKQCEPIASESFLTSFPKTVNSGEACEINAFVRCEGGEGLTGAEVTVNVINGSVAPTTSLTDENGRAVFTVTPDGLAQITATVNGVLAIPNTVTCESQ